MTPGDLDQILASVAEQRADADSLTRALATLGDALADGIRGSAFESLDMETVGTALVIAATSLAPWMDRDVSPAMLLRALVLGGENLIRTARARAAEINEHLADLEERFEAALAEDVPRPMLVPEWTCEALVLTWHQLNGAPPVEIPFDTHWVFHAEVCGEFRLSTREHAARRADGVVAIQITDTRVARILMDHARRDAGQCFCGWGNEPEHLGQQHSLHVVAELRAAGLLPGDGRG